MKVGIIGLPQTGKNTLFQVLTGTDRTGHTELKKPLIGTADMLDRRFDTLTRMYDPQKEARAKIDIVLLPKIEKETIAKGDIFSDIADMDAICHVVRAFEDESIYHVDGFVDPLRDIEMVNTELILHDLLFIEKRLEKIEINLKKLKNEKQQKEKILLLKMRGYLESEKPLRLMEISPDESSLISGYPFITQKQMILTVNASDYDAGNEEITEQLKLSCEKDQMKAMQVSAKVESEIADIECEEERNEFLEELGIKEPALSKLAGLCIDALGLISFFTVGKDEVRQWLIRRNSSAPVAAGAIHSDLQRGFIRAEVIKYDELMEHKNEAGLKNAGKLYVKGKDYVVEDGDILNIRFKV